MEGFDNTSSIGSARRWESTRRKWAPYDSCGTCHAVAGNPCRNQQRSGWAAATTLRSEPHPGRPKKPEPPCPA